MLSVSFPVNGIQQFGADIRARINNLPAVAPAVFQAMYFAPGGGTQVQFTSETEISKRGANPWPKSHPFGNRKMGSRTLRNTGAYQNAWTGKAGAIKTVEPKPGGATFSVGVSAAQFPQARVFQKRTNTIVRPKKMGKGGRSSMGWFLGMNFGVWLSEARLKKGLVIKPRRVSMNNQVGEAVKKILSNWILRGRVRASA